VRTTVNLPRLGDTVDEVNVVEWAKAPGDQVSVGDVLLRVETEKAVVEVPSPVAGRLTERLAEPDDEVSTGDPIAIVETG
jgi:pyruvate/2-oxoglutarate dehydrogenase complex dihydrolipoamide acyltransferase (E2) component